MLIEGPMSITIAEPADGQGKVLTILFTPEFQTLPVSQQGDAFECYLMELHSHITSDAALDERNRAGMAIVHQFAQQLLPHIQAGELALEERIVLQIRQEAQAQALHDLLSPDAH